MKSDRPVFILMSSDWFHLGSRDAPLVRQAEPVIRPAGINIGPFKDKICPAGNTTNKSEDHDWRQRKKNVDYTKEAIFERNWPHPETHGEHDTYINNRRSHSESVNAQISKQIDGHQKVNNMNNLFRVRFQALHLSTWIPIRDVPDEEPNRPPLQRPDMIITERPLPDRAVANKALDEKVVRRITIAYDVA